MGPLPGAQLSGSFARAQENGAVHHLRRRKEADARQAVLEPVNKANSLRTECVALREHEHPLLQGLRAFDDGTPDLVHTLQHEELSRRDVDVREDCFEQLVGAEHLCSR